MEIFKGFKTILFNLIMVVLAVNKNFNPDCKVSVSQEEVNSFLNVMDILFVTFWGFGNIFIRFFTDSKIFNGRISRMQKEKRKSIKENLL